MISQLLTILSKRRYLLPCVRLKRPGHVHSYAEPRGTDQRPSIDQEHGKGPCPTTSAAGHVEAVRWKDIELYFVTLPGQRTTIAARVTIRLLKGKRNDDSKSKANVLRLLPEDPLLCPIFELLTLADQGGVSTMSAEDAFDEVLRPSRDPVGSRQPIPLDATKGEQFVFRDYEGGANGATASTRAADVKWLDERCLSVGLPAGFIGRHTIYVWRRMGFEAINDPSVTVADRDHQWGHDPNSDVYQAYLSRTSLIDVQGLALGIGQQTNEILAVVQNTTHLDVAQELSPAQVQEIWALPHIAELTRQLTIAKARLAEEHPGTSIEAGIRAGFAAAEDAKELQTLRFTRVRAARAHNLHQSPAGSSCVSSKARETTVIG